MDFKQYQENAERTLKSGGSLEFDLNHMALGVAGEEGIRHHHRKPIAIAVPVELEEGYGLDE